MRPSGHAVHRRENRYVQRVLVGKPKERHKLEEPSNYRKILLKRILNRMGGHGLDSYGSGQGQVSGSCVYDNETSGSIKCDCLQ
jgi:hypothetical protein